MATYRARPCPNCNYYLGFNIAKSTGATNEMPVHGLCLNCGYKVPVRAVLRGAKKAMARPKLRRARNAPTPFRNPAAKTSAPPALRRYAADLRAIGQDLERRRLSTFNLECAGGSYWVWARMENVAPAWPRPGHDPLRRFWRWASGALSGQPRPEIGSAPSFKRISYRYNPADIDRIDGAGKARRRGRNGITDGHSLSQLLRTLGALVNQRGQTLLGISWQDQSVSVVVETPQKRRQLDIFRHDNIYDCWVKLYLRRVSRTCSDVPT